MTVTADVRTVENVIGGKERAASGGGTFEKLAPATGESISLVARSSEEDVDAAIAAAEAAQPDWAARPVEERGRILRRVAQLLERDRERVAAVVSAETGKSPKDAKGETDGAIELGYFIAGEGRRFYGRTMPSATPNRSAMTIRQPLGVAGLIIAANTPIANVAWKVFPALLCGNAAVLKASEDAPETANVFARLAAEAGCPGRRAERRPRLRRRGRAAAGRGSACRRRVVHRLDRGRPADRPRRRRAPRQGLPRARRQEPARRLRRREPGALGRGGRAVGVLERRPALRSRLTADRVRRRLRPLSRAPDRAGAGPEGRAGRRARLRAGDQRAAARAHAGCGRAREGRGCHGGHGRREARPAGLLPCADHRRGRGSRLRDLLHRAVRTDHDAPPRRGLRGGDRSGEREPVRPDGGDLDARASIAARSSSGGSSPAASR